MKRIKCIIVCLLLFGQLQAQQTIKNTHYDSYKGLVMAGYQGWFAAEGDDSNRGWYHYGFRGDNASIDFWPDMTEYTKKYITPFKMSDGSDAYLFSSYDEESVDLHFRWMKEYGIDGVFMQRFVTEIKRPAGKRHFNKVLESALNAARKYDRAIGVMYDLSGCLPEDMKVLEDDWKELQSLFSLTDRKQNPTYIRHNKRPLLTIWGVGFDNRKYSTTDVQQVITNIKQTTKVSIMLGVPYFWRTLSRDTENNPLLHTLIKNNVDIVMPWAVGRYNNDTYASVAAGLSDDIKWCQDNKVDYVPLVFPGFSWGNLRRDTALYNEIPRLKGDFLWHQVTEAKAAGATSLYVAMFDEIDEGTAIFKCAEEEKLPIFGEKRFVGIEQGLGSDYYLWLVGEATKWFHGTKEYSAEKPKRNKKRESLHPRIYITDDQKSVFANKLKTIDWAKQSYEKIKSDVDPYVDQHFAEPEWIISRMQMYWDTHYERVYVKGNAFSHGTGRAPVPTVKFAGNRDGATDYAMPSLEDTQPYMDEKGMYLQNMKKEGRPWEWVHPSKTGRMIGPMNDRIMKMAANAAFLYWHTGEEKYAVFASDIFLTYVKGMNYRREPFALEDYGNSHLMGLATFEVILDHLIPDMAVCYDFIYDYLKRKDADFDMIATVFKRFAEQQIMYGVPDNNWNIFQARHVTYLALALDDNSFYKDGRGKQYYLNEILNNTTIRQFALKEMIDESFDLETGLWPESATYSMSVCKDMLDVICLIDNAENNHILDTFPILKKAVPATVEYLFPNGRVTAFGDARYVPLRPQPFEMLIALYRKYKEADNEKRLTQVLSKLIVDSAYNRSENKDMFSLFFYVDKLMDITPAKVTYDHLICDTYYAPNVSWLIQRNGRDRQDGMAFTLTGAYGNHAHANGISLEMYGKGLMLAPESSYGITYGTRDNQEYYARFPAHNTVIVDGKSDYGMMRSNHPYQLLSCYPAHGENLLPADKVSFARVGFLEPKTDAHQDRLTSIIRTGEKSAYVVDIFRSARNDGKDLKHEYLYHSIGGDIDVTNATGQKLLLLPTKELSSEAGDMNGYNYFENKKTVNYDQDFKAQFHIGLEQQEDVVVDMWMKGYPGRTIFDVVSPKSNAFDKGSTPEELLGKSLPTLIVRQKGEAWNRPFVAVYQPYTYMEGSSIRSVDYFGNTGNFVGITVQSASRTDYIFNSASDDPDISYRNMQFKGNYAVIGETNGALECLFLGNGRFLAWEKWSITSKDADVQASLNRSSNDIFELATSGEIILAIPVSGDRQPELSEIEQPGTKLQGSSENGIYTVQVPAGKYRMKL